ncbi:hypothetical protein [Microbispora sp. KK1-11]|uniref:hypothetical protein n=1 Tax=Microbispora sp. KK1-11 TaxID=2053005 RepID=UPI0011590CBF|nr:hypothetical protein [Microbispora sp. KK1-11]TQS30080.1 hypothetical protein FLW16_06880 [Microbispora sp. KK1-11]
MTTPMTDTDQRPDLDVRPLAYALHHMIPDLHAVILPGECWESLRARRDAAADIFDDLLAEAAEAVS